MSNILKGATLFCTTSFILRDGNTEYKFTPYVKYTVITMFNVSREMNVHLKDERGNDYFLKLPDLLLNFETVHSKRDRIIKDLI